MTCTCVPLAGVGLGSGPLGSFPLGTGVPLDAFTLGVGQMLTANLAIVGFSGDVGDPPNPTNPDSPLWPGNWVLTPDAPSSQSRLVQSVQLVTADTLSQFTGDYPQLTAFALPLLLVFFDGTLTPGGLYELEIVGVTGCECTALVGLTVRPDATPTDERESDGSILDLANPWLSKDALVLPPVLGTFQRTDTGDLGLDRDGDSSLRKRLIRRVLTAAGAFFHLPNYGTALGPKSLIKADTAERLQARIRAQVLQEPEVTDVTVAVTQLQSTGLVTATLRVVTARGQAIGLSVPISLP